jgi:Holliday junction resolvase
MNSRAKGCRGEREFRDVLRDQGFTARRGQQFSGSPDSPDVLCEELPNIHFEVKRCENGNVYRWLDQAMRDCGMHKMPIVVHKKNGRQWVAILDVDDLINLLKAQK